MHRDLLTPDARGLLRQLGLALDEDRPLHIGPDGFVTLEPQWAETHAENEDDERQGTGRPPTRPWEGSEGRAWWTAGEPPRPFPPVGNDDVRASYERGLADACDAYPTLSWLPDDRGIWLRAESAVLQGLNARAMFLVGVPFFGPIFPRAWGFWLEEAGPQWIGPRHTNMPDGSICAFVQSSGIWKIGGPLVGLLDLYTEWALRQAHLAVFGKWPGPQDAPNAYYRRVEFKDDERCSCQSGKSYADCCKSADSQRSLEELRAEFIAQMGIDLLRNPPSAVVEYVSGGREEPPSLAQVHI